ncbi:2-succinyl-5-enolpyruvyl-6-hydroxy-3-cyclohexene-1-carboxylic-acid synthase [Cellulosimicrobium sp. Marseille-Q4280]|uniref:2-succinyl-5-enolpyruvyl-6-hydroxy-3- cyclohexene-1-carboxylic-acid synthase n=1 Tax=Cellulosimicrobium sp. Marseille-Q4280 TaxID=2937992 RepID=UPI00203D6C12|nr:2-succinyl-5-enolpyruvyl-6-hydroxy-3-cyclohexene-1-carboxylic-acid synthase [Cellulosimicrobium sp. Marseille-Q4280]
MSGAVTGGAVTGGAPGETAGAQQPPAVRAACALVARLVREGVRDVVLAPGSRSAPLAYAVAAAADAGLLTLHVRVDERSAAFLALGLARGSAPVEAAGGVAMPRPVAVVTTSGTAVANLHPAVLEAHHAGVPLVLLTADRPHELRGTGANQTTDQVGIFGSAVRLVVDQPAPDGRDGELRDLLAVATRALAAATGARTGAPGPVHLDLAYREPLVPVSALGAADVDPATAGVRRTGVVPALVSGPRQGWPTGRTVVVAGDGAGAVARELAEARGWPLLAEPSSGAVGGPNAVPAASLVLGVAELADDVEEVVVLGRPTLTRPVQRLLGREDVSVAVVAPAGAPWPDAARNAWSVLPAVPPEWLVPAPEVPAAADAEEADRRWPARWRAAARAAARVVDAATTGDRPTGPAVARAVAEACGADDVLVVGSSNPVRDLDVVLGVALAEDAADDRAHDAVSRTGRGAPRVVANRGLAGIDGTVSTALGVALAEARRGRRTRALLGDLTFLHDVGGLLRGPHEPHVDLQLVVVNDDGGSIFAGLEPGALGESSTAAGATFERVFSTPHGANLAHLCSGYGVDHQLVPDVASLRHALAAPSHGVQVLEIQVPRTDRRADAAALAAAVDTAVVEALAG